MSNIKAAQAQRRIAALNRPMKIDGKYFPTRMAAMDSLIERGYRVKDHDGGPRLVKGESFYLQSDVTKAGVDYIREQTAEEGYAQYYNLPRGKNSYLVEEPPSCMCDHETPTVFGCDHSI